MWSRGALWLSAALLVSFGASLAINHLSAQNSRLWPWSPVFLALLFTILLFVYRTIKDATALVQTLIAAFIIKFLTGIVLLLVVSLVWRGEFLHFALHFILHWFLFTLAEIAYLSVSLKHKPLKNEN